MSDCRCGDYTLANLGRPGCVNLIKTTTRVAFQHKFDSTGARNFIDTSGGVFDEAFFSALINHPDPSKRLYLTPRLENVTHPITERTTESFGSGREVETRPEYLGLEGFTVEKDAASEISLQMSKMKCADLQVYYIDISSSLIGDASQWSANKLYGIPVLSGTFNKGRMLATDTETGKIRIGFQHDYTFNDGNMGGIQGSMLANDVNLNTIPAVQNVNGVISTPTTTAVTVTLTGNFIEGIGFNPIVGLIAANFVIKTSTGSPIVVTGAVEGADGVYVLSAVMSAGNYTLDLNLPYFVMPQLTFTTV